MTANLESESLQFAEDTQALLDAVLPLGPREDIELRRLKVIEAEDNFVVRPGDATKASSIQLLKNGNHVASLDLQFSCSLDRSRGYLAVRKSSFQLKSVKPKESQPLLRLDFDHKAYAVPAAHWNIHAERGATSVLLSRSNPSHNGLLSQVHLPVGGIRHRPCLEDFLEMLIDEFRFDTCPGWRNKIIEGRRSWRVLQARSVVRDCPEDAADVLRRLGYSVSPPNSGHPARNDDVLGCR